jgi:hypothetical protein
MSLYAPIDIVRIKTPAAESDGKDSDKIFQKRQPMYLAMQMNEHQRTGK